MTMTDLLGDVTDEPVRIIRPPKHVSCEYSNQTNKFIERNVEFKNQYCKLYTVRLAGMLPLLNDRIVKKWGDKYPIVQLHKLQETPNIQCVVTGTLFKDQKLKPSPLKKIAAANALIPQPIYTHFTDDSDLLFIEDELQRYEVLGEINIHNLVTGITCALLGVDQGMGKFLVEDYCFVDCRPQIDRLLSQSDEKFICFVSGLDLVNYANNLMSLKLFTDWLIGFMGDVSAQEEVKKISRLVIAGNSVRSDAEVKKTTSLVAKVVESSETFNAVQQFDKVLNQFVRFLSVDLMPGQFDPSNHLLSQQPLHKCMFPLSAKYKNLNCVSNPYECEIAGLKMLGTSGQPVTDITSYSRIEEPIEALEQCLRWSHIAPTAPDTLGSYPYYDRDPFIIEECPHILFAGNQPKYQTKLCKGAEDQTVRLICIPQFSKTFSVVLLNINTLECHEMYFNVENMS